MIRRILLLVFGFMLFGQPLFAHDVWIVREGDKYVVLYGHGDKTDPYDPKKVRDVMAFDATGKGFAPEVKRLADSVVVVPTGKEAMVTVFFDNGFWAKTTDGWKNISKRELAGFQLVEPAVRHSLKYGKSIFAWNDAFTKPVGMRFEIVPMKNPLQLKAGDELPIKVFFEGNPLKDSVISTDYPKPKDLAKTDSNGIAKVKIEGVGKHILVAKHRVPLKDNPDADIASFSTTLFFEVK